MNVFCILLAVPRSGTTMLGDAVSRCFQAAWPQEIFHSEHAGPEIDFRTHPDIKPRCNFFNFRHEFLSQNHRLLFPSAENQSAILEAYLDYLVSSEKTKNFLLDIKYSSWHHLNHYWWRPGQIPHLLSHVIKQRFPLVHLKRRNLFALYCSQKLAEATGVWSTLTDDVASDRRLVVDAPNCADALETIRATERMFDKWLSGHPHYQLYYEDLLTADGFSDEVVRTFSEVYGIEPIATLTTEYRKVTPPLRDVVVNRDDVLSALRGTDFEAMAECALA
jgi:LPS sulfotransferase NodH